MFTPTNCRTVLHAVDDVRQTGKNANSGLPIGGGDENEIDVDLDDNRPSTFGEKTPPDVSIMNAKNEDRTTSFFAQPGILAGKWSGSYVSGKSCVLIGMCFVRFVAVQL